jgi:hypothetical protein
MARRHVSLPLTFSIAGRCSGFRVLRRHKRRRRGNCAAKSVRRPRNVFDLQTNQLRAKTVANPGAGREHVFRAWRLKGSPADPVSMSVQRPGAEVARSDDEHSDR